jgi:hypothetical protein
MRWARLGVHMREKRKVYRVLAGKPEGKRPLARPRCRWEDGIRMDLRKTRWGVQSGSNWIWAGGGLL